jgi:hypothetical protein
LRGCRCWTYDCDVDLNRCAYPQRICEPRLVVRGNQALPDEVSSDNSGDGNDDARRQQHTNTDTLLQRHAESEDNWNGQYGAEKICNATDDPACQGDHALVQTLAVNDVWKLPICLHRSMVEESVENVDRPQVVIQTYMQAKTTRRINEIKMQRLKARLA